MRSRPRRIHGHFISACPQCEKVYAKPGYEFIYQHPFPVWSDGWFGPGTLAAQPQVCLCDCGALFLWVKAIEIGYEPSAPQQEPKRVVPEVIDTVESLRDKAETKPAVSWSKTLRSLFKRSPTQGHRTQVPTVAATKPLLWPEANFVEPNDFLALCVNKPRLADSDLEIALRREYWWWRNNQRRWAETPEDKTLPLDTVETDNLQKLLLLLLNRLDDRMQDDAENYYAAETETWQPDRWLEIGEIQRELGLFDDAIGSFARVRDDNLCITNKLIQLARDNQPNLFGPTQWQDE